MKKGTIIAVILIIFLINCSPKHEKFKNMILDDIVSSPSMLNKNSLLNKNTSAFEYDKKNIIEMATTKDDYEYVVAFWIKNRLEYDDSQIVYIVNNSRKEYDTFQNSLKNKGEKIFNESTGKWISVDWFLSTTRVDDDGWPKNGNASKEAQENQIQFEILKNDIKYWIEKLEEYSSEANDKRDFKNDFKPTFCIEKNNYNYPVTLGGCIGAATYSWNKDRMDHLREYGKWK